MSDLIPRNLMDEAILPWRGRLRRFFDDPTWAEWGEEGALALDLYKDEEANALVAKASLPGFADNEVEVHVESGVLSISGTHSEEHETKDERYYRRERRSGAVHRRISLPSPVDADAVDAVLKDGVLTVTLPITQEAAATQVEVKKA